MHITLLKQPVRLIAILHIVDVLSAVKKDLVEDEG
jgi:hypothetical protein